VRRIAATALLFGLLAPAASAHVTIVPAAARPGETATLTFRVLNERDDASTVRVGVFLPAGTHVEAKPRPGWNETVTPAEVDWNADGADGAIGGESSKDFELTLGPLPKRDRLVFKVLQYYSDGEIVRWIQDPKPGAERPAPVLQLTASGRPATGGAGGAGGSSAGGWAILAGVLVVGIGAAVLTARRRA
jgi:uncharacterized protein YcnI